MFNYYFLHERTKKDRGNKLSKKELRKHTRSFSVMSRQYCSHVSVIQDCRLKVGKAPDKKKLKPARHPTMFLPCRRCTSHLLQTPATVVYDDQYTL
jgi:hypothetical protein